MCKLQAVLAPRHPACKWNFVCLAYCNWGDVGDVVKLVAPRALFLQATSNDVWSRGAKAIFENAKSSFPVEKLKLKIWPGVHVFTPEMRQAAYSFLDENLMQGVTGR